MINPSFFFLFAVIYAVSPESILESTGQGYSLDGMPAYHKAGVHHEKDVSLSAYQKAAIQPKTVVGALQCSHNLEKPTPEIHAFKMQGETV